MKTYTIPAKSSNSGSIHDIASEYGDRFIRFYGDCVFAVVTADWYGGKGYTTHKTAEAAVKASKALGDYSHEIIDSTGARYIVEPGYWCNRLVHAG